MNAYLKLKNKHQEEVNAFPLHFAFGDEQMERKRKELKLSKDPGKRATQIISIGGGGFILREDWPAYLEMCRRHHQEREDAINSDETGEGYIYDMFRYELRNHEYGYTLDVSDTIDGLGYTMEQIEASPKLKHGLEKAAQDIRKAEGIFWGIDMGEENAEDE